MKKLWIALAAMIVINVALLGSFASAARQQYVNQADVDAAERFIQKAQEFDASMRSAKTRGDVSMHLQTLSSEASRLELHRFSTKISPRYDAAAKRLQKASADLKSAIAPFQAAIISGDREKIAAAEPGFTAGINKATGEIDAAFAEMTAAVEESNTAQGRPYLVAFVVSAILAVPAMLWAFTRREATTALTKARRMVGWSSLWPLAGAGITYITYIFADKLGGTFYIAYGPVLFGLVLFATSIANYRKLRKDNVAAGYNQASPPPSQIPPAQS